MIVGRILLGLLGVIAVLGGAALGSRDGWVTFMLGIALIMGGGGAFMMAALGRHSMDSCGKEGCDCEL